MHILVSELCRSSSALQHSLGRASALHFSSALLAPISGIHATPQLLCDQSREKVKALGPTHMQMVSILVCNHQQSPEGFGVLDVHLRGGMKHGQAAHAGDKCAPQHAHAKQRGDFDGSHHSSQAHVDPDACSMHIITFSLKFFDCLTCLRACLLRGMAGKNLTSVNRSGGDGHASMPISATPVSDFADLTGHRYAVEIQ